MAAEERKTCREEQEVFEDMCAIYRTQTIAWTAAVRIPFGFRMDSVRKASDCSFGY